MEKAHAKKNKTEEAFSVIVLIKVAFFRKFDSFFKSPNLPKKIFQKTILDLKFKIPAHNSIIFMGRNSLGDLEI